MAELGRPTKATPETIAILLAAFANKATVEEACEAAKIDHSTFHRWMKADKDFATKIADARELIDRIAIGNLAREIYNGDKETSKWWASTRMKDEFSTRTENTGKNGTPLIPTFTVATTEAKQALESLYAGPDSSNG